MVSAVGGPGGSEQINDLAQLLQGVKGGDGASTRDGAASRVPADRAEALVGQGQQDPTREALGKLLQQLNSAPAPATAEQQATVAKNRLPKEAKPNLLEQIFSVSTEGLKKPGTQVVDQAEQMFKLLTGTVQDELKSELQSRAREHKNILKESGILDKLFPSLTLLLEEAAKATQSIAANVTKVFSNNKPAILDTASKLMTMITQVAKQHVSGNPIAMSALAFDPSNN
jgi:hypothetical protein